MALANYADLVSYMTDMLELDTQSAARLPDYIALAEAELTRLLDDGKGDDLAIASTVAATQAVSLPGNMNFLRSLTLEDTYDRFELTPLDLGSFRSMYADNTQGRPEAYAIFGSEALLGPIPDAVYELTAHYNTNIPGLSTANTTNWLLTSHPDAYVYAISMQVQPWMMDDTRGARMQAQLDRIVRQINDNAAQYRTPDPRPVQFGEMVMLNRRLGFNINRGW